MKSQISLENLITFLLTTPMFEDLDPREVKEIAHIVETKKYAAGEEVFHEGEPGDAWYSLYRGKLEVVKSSDGGEEVLRVLEPPSCFGEIAILDGQPRSATVRAVDDSTVVRIIREKFEELVDQEHLVAYKLIRYMALTLVKEVRSNT